MGACKQRVERTLVPFKKRSRSNHVLSLEPWLPLYSLWRPLLRFSTWYLYSTTLGLPVTNWYLRKQLLSHQEASCLNQGQKMLVTMFQANVTLVEHLLDDDPGVLNGKQVRLVNRWISR